MRLGLVGYGVGGRYFHAPFVVAADGVELAGVVTRSPQRRAEFAEDHPDVPVFDSMADLIAAGVDAVTITTPPQTRRELVLAALAAGVHVIADKPFAPTAEAGRDLVRAADKAGLVLNVFHNQRWDADIRTLAAVLATQALWLLGPAHSVHAELDWVNLPDGRTDGGFIVTIMHATGVRSHLSASKLNRIQERELRAHGSAGGYVARGADVQAKRSSLVSAPSISGGLGLRGEGALGHAAHRGRFGAGASEQGAYQAYYAQFAAALRGDATYPVPAIEAVHALGVLDAARTSAEENRVVLLTGDA